MIATRAPAPDRVLPVVARVTRGVLRLAIALVAALVVFSAFLTARGVTPHAALLEMVRSALGSERALGEVLVQATPFVLAGLATAVPARAGLFNVGGEGQMVLGAVGAALAANALNGQILNTPTLVAMALAGAAAGAAWAMTPALLRAFAGVSEVISTLLLNSVAVLLLAWLVHGRWKDAANLGLPQGRALLSNERLPIVWGYRVHAGIFIALAVALLTWAVLRFTGWGFRLRVVGGNAEAARRAGLPVAGLVIGALVVGGAIAGLAGMVELAGVEGRVRPGMMAGFGYVGFLTSWLVRHHPLRVIGGAFLLGGIAVGGSSLQLDSGLPAASVNILMALVLLAVLGRGHQRRPAAAVTT